MKVFADKTETAFFSTDKHVKNLHPVEITSIEDFIFRYSQSSDILLGLKCWMVGRFDELTAGSQVIDSSSDEPELIGECLNVDFVADMPLLDILATIAQYEDVSYSLEDYKKANIFESVEDEWVNDDTDHQWTFKAWNDSRVLTLIVADDGSVSATIDE